MRFSRLLPLLLVAACRSPQAPPAAQFLVVAGDSTFWVRTRGVGGCTSEDVCVRGSPIQLVRYGGRFYELYVEDDDRSFGDASIVGQLVYRRDLASGDSAVVFRDSVIAGVVGEYARRHPEDRPLTADDEASDDPGTDAGSEIDLLDGHGSLVNFEYNADGESVEGGGWAMVRRGVLDVARGREATLAGLFGDSIGEEVHRKGERLYRAMIDSLRSLPQASAPGLAEAIPHFHFDPRSFGLVTAGRQPTVEFVVPGEGDRAGGLSFALPLIPVQPPAGWMSADDQLPGAASDSLDDRWPRAGYQVIARYAADASGASLALLDSAGHRWSVGQLPSPVWRIFWLDRPALDSLQLHALARAFDEASTYGVDTRLVGLRRHRPALRRPIVRWARTSRRRALPHPRQ